MAKTAKEIHKTMHGVFDNFTNRNLFKLISEGFFDGVVGPISIGKEANIFLARGKEEDVALKIYRLSNCDFNKMYDYLKFDPRYSGLKKHRRKIIFAWAQREYRNLMKARDAGVSVPKPLTFKSNILVLEFIGKENAAPRLKDMYPSNPEKFCDETLKNMKKLHKAGLVHGDLSEFNILNFEDRPVFIDFSTCTVESDPMFKEYLERDVNNICRFFKKLKMNKEPKDVMKEVMK